MNTMILDTTTSATTTTTTEKETRCFDSTNEIDDAIIVGDLRQAFNDCDHESTCDKYHKAGYRCAPSWTCHNNTIITDGVGLIDVRSDDFLCSKTSGILDASDGKCKKIDHVCCKHPNLGASKCPPIIKPAKKGEEISFAQCGRSSSELKITGQDEKYLNAQHGEFPHMCVIYRLEQGQKVYIGGASLIARNKVITIAHKFYIVTNSRTADWRDQPSEFYIRCGEHNVKNEVELVESQESQVEEIIIHPQYEARRNWNNLAILRTKQNFVYQDHIGPVCLPKPFQNFGNQRNCWSSGWGADAYDSYALYSDFLKKVQMPVVPTSECETRMRSTERFKKKAGFRIHNSWLCIGGEKGSDTCKGDGGSPHVCKTSKNRWVQVGAVAWEVGCGEEVPSVYSSVPAAMCWIDWVMSCVPITEYDI